MNWVPLSDPFQKVGQQLAVGELSLGTFFVTLLAQPLSGFKSTLNCKFIETCVRVKPEFDNRLIVWSTLLKILFILMWLVTYLISFFIDFTVKTTGSLVSFTVWFIILIFGFSLYFSLYTLLHASLDKELIKYWISHLLNWEIYKKIWLRHFIPWFTFCFI